MNALAAAARRTLDSDSARITESSTWHPPLTNGLTGTGGAGILDFRARRAFMRRDRTVQIQVFNLILKRHPWLTSGDDATEQDDLPIEYIYADGESFRRAGEPWHRSDDDTRAISDPIGLLERLARCNEMHPRDGCFGFLIAEGRGRLYGDAWLDDEGRIARVTYRWWSPRRRRRKAASELWTTVELMDFGRPVRIEIPEVEEAEEDVEYAFDPWGVIVDIGRVARGAWRMYRRWRVARPRSRGERERGRRA